MPRADTQRTEADPAAATGGFLFPMRPSVPKVLPPTPHAFLVQSKYDGWNVVVAAGRVWTRRGRDITDWCVDWGFDLGLAHAVNGELLAEVDGEVADRPDIQGIRSGRCRPRLVAFDIMREGPPLEERLALLGALVGDGSSHARGASRRSGLHLAPTLDPGADATWADVNALLADAVAQGHEGLLLKRKGSLYHLSREVSIVTRDWLKLKVAVRTGG